MNFLKDKRINLKGKNIKIPIVIATTGFSNDNQKLIGFIFFIDVSCC